MGLRSSPIAPHAPQKGDLPTSGIKEASVEVSDSTKVIDSVQVEATRVALERTEYVERIAKLVVPAASIAGALIGSAIAAPAVGVLVAGALAVGAAASGVIAVREHREAERLRQRIAGASTEAISENS